MSERAIDRPPWWRRLGGLLPPEIRERVFEPACFERLHRQLDGDLRVTGIPFPLYALAAFVGVAGFNFPGVLFDGRRLSRLGKLTAGMVVLAAGVAWAITMVRYAYD